MRPLRVAAALLSPGASPFSVSIADTLIARYPDPNTIHWKDNTNHFSWQAGYAMFTLEKLWKLTGDPHYLAYIQRYVDQQVVCQGGIAEFDEDTLDDFIPGYPIL